MAIDLTDEFDGLIDDFTAASSDLVFSETIRLFVDSRGAAITDFNTALICYCNCRMSVEDLYAATSFYLNKAKDNIYSCELDNTVEGEGEG